MRAFFGAVALLAACWSGSTPPAPAPTTPAAVRQQGLVAIFVEPEDATRAPYLSWHDLDSGESGEIQHGELDRYLPLSSIARQAWFSASSDDIIQISRPSGPGVVITKIERRIGIVSPDGNRFVRCSGVDRTICQIGSLTDPASPERPINAPSLPQHDNFSAHRWLRDGRIVFGEDGNFAIWFVDPNTGATTTFPLSEHYDDVSDDGSLILWVTYPPGKPILHWKRLADGDAKSLELDASTGACGFTRTSLIYCDTHQGGHGTLLVIPPATGQARVLARDVSLNLAGIKPSIDGRYIAYPSASEKGERTVIVDVVTGQATPIGPLAKRSNPMVWLAPR